MGRTRAQIVAELTAQGLRFRTFTLDEVSPHSIRDWDWNQRDLPHIPFVHGGFRFVRGVVEDDHAGGVFLQRVLGVPLPMVVMFQHPERSRGERVYQASLGPLTVIIESVLAEAGAGTALTTHYSIGGLPVAGLLLPLAERLLRRNAALLRREDEPLLARRSRLREWGYRFEGDADDASYLRSLDLRADRVIAPSVPARGEHVTLCADVDEVLLGRDDHQGLRARVDRTRRVLEVFPRMCSHEGASLDGCAVREGAIACPWHGRRVGPVASFDLRPDGCRTSVVAGCTVSFDGTNLTRAPI